MDVECFGNFGDDVASEEHVVYKKQDDGGIKRLTYIRKYLPESKLGYVDTFKSEVLV